MPEPANVQIAAELFAKIITWKDQRSACMFLFRETEEIRGKTNLGFDLFFAVAEIIIGDERNNHTAGIARRKLE